MNWILFITLLAAAAAFYLLGGGEYLSLETFQANRQLLQAHVAEHPALSVLVFAAVYIVVVATSLPFATLFTLLAGFLFGRWLGTALVVAAGTVGASTLFLLARSTLGEFLRRRALGWHQKLERGMNTSPASYLLFVRVVPLFPFFAINLAAALLNIRLRTFVWTTAVGIIPGSFVYTNLGTELGQIETANDLLSPTTLAAFTLLGVLALVPVLYKTLCSKKRQG